MKYTDKLLTQLALGFLMLLAIKANSQSATETQNVEVAFNKTSSIVFPAVITSVDRGSRDVLAQKAKGVNNVLQLKAGKVNFKETNLTVITGDGKLHHFVVRYSEKPSTFTIQAGRRDTAEKAESLPLFYQNEMTEADLEKNAKAILSRAKIKRMETVSKYDMQLSLVGIFIQGNIMFYHLRLTNKSNIPYHPDMLRFFVKDKQKVKRTASQEVDEIPLYHSGNASVILGKSAQELVYAFPKFTIPGAKALTIELTEKRGGRHLSLSITNKKIVKALPIPAD